MKAVPLQPNTGKMYVLTFVTHYNVIIVSKFIRRVCGMAFNFYKIKSIDAIGLYY